MKKNNYRELYKRYYGIDFGGEYDIHHIDFNRKNNTIENLILLPKELHHRYHFCINALRGQDGKIVMNAKIQLFNGCTYEIDMVQQLCETMREIGKWKLYKVNLDWKKTIERYNNVSGESQKNN